MDAEERARRREERRKRREAERAAAEAAITAEEDDAAARRARREERRRQLEENAAMNSQETDGYSYTSSYRSQRQEPEEEQTVITSSYRSQRQEPEEDQTINTSSYRSQRQEPEEEQTVNSYSYSSSYKSRYSTEPEPEPVIEREPTPEPEPQSYQEPENLSYQEPEPDRYQEREPERYQEPEPEPYQEPEQYQEPEYADEPEPEVEPEPEPARTYRKIEEPKEEKPRPKRIPTIDRTDDDGNELEALQTLEELREKREREEQERLEQHLEQRRLEREEQERELEQLRKRKEQRKKEHEEREKKRREEEAERKAREEEEARKRREEMEQRKALAEEKRRNLANDRVQLIAAKKLDLKANIVKAKQDAAQSVESVKVQREKALAECVPEFQADDSSTIRELQAMAKEYHDHLYNLLTDIFNMQQHKKIQDYDLHEYTQRLDQINSKASTKKLGLGVGVETHKVSRFMEQIGKDDQKLEKTRYSRFKERNEGIAASGGVAGRLSMFQQKVDQPEPATTTPKRSGGSKVWKPPAGDKCHICCKTVYAMEKLEADSKVFHKACFRCDVCKSTINLTNYAVLENKYYCKSHQKKVLRDRAQAKLNSQKKSPASNDSHYMQQNHNGNGHSYGEADDY